MRDVRPPRSAPVAPTEEIVVLAAEQASTDSSASSGASGAQLYALTTMATWCVACKKELPQLAELRARFSPDELRMIAVPVDEDDDEAKLASYRAQLSPAYEVAPLPREQVEQIERVVLAQLGSEALPATLLTDREGRLLRTFDRAPTPAEVEMHLSPVP